MNIGIHQSVLAVKYRHHTLTNVSTNPIIPMELIRAKRYNLFTILDFKLDPTGSLALPCRILCST